MRAGRAEPSAGRLWRAEDLAEHLSGYGPMLRSMGGGITLSGGEPLYQWEFAAELLGRLKGMHRAVETSGYAEEAAFRARSGGNGLCDDGSEAGGSRAPPQVYGGGQRADSAESAGGCSRAESRTCCARR